MEKLVLLLSAMLASSGSLPSLPSVYQDLVQACNDDNVSVTIDDVTLAEADAGNTNFVFTVTLDVSDPDDDIVIDYTTNDGTASDASDFTANSGTLTFAAGTATLTQTITVQVSGDTTVEGNETFTVDLSLNAGNTGSATITDTQGLGTINNDDNASIRACRTS